MRKVVFIAAGLFLIACGPDPNARLPGDPTPAKGSGGSGSGGMTENSGGSGGNAGTTTKTDGTGGSSNPFEKGGAGGNTPLGTGGSTKNTGGKDGSVVGGNGGITNKDGGVGTGGMTIIPLQGGRVGGSGGIGGSGSSTGYEWGVGDPPCSPAKDLSCASGGSGQTGNFGSTTEYCFRTGDTIVGWGCSSFEGWTLTVNGVATTCPAGSSTTVTFPPKLNGLYYFYAVGSGPAKEWASINWWGTCDGPPYPAWGGTTSADAAIITPKDASRN
jgi:hypothetical protein